MSTENNSSNFIRNIIIDDLESSTYWSCKIYMFKFFTC